MAPPPDDFFRDLFSSWCFPLYFETTIFFLSMPFGPFLFLFALRRPTSFGEELSSVAFPLRDLPNVLMMMPCLSSFPDIPCLVSELL